jgi:hypothetical protein
MRTEGISMKTPWKVEPIYKPLIHGTDTLKADGYSDDRIIDALLGIALTWAQHRHGSRGVSQRLYVLAMKFAEEADRLESASIGAGGCVH